MTAASAKRVVSASALVALACGGGPAQPQEVLMGVANGGYVAEVLPPLTTGCGLVQPGFDEATYDIFSDRFCTATSVYRWSRDEHGTYRDDWLYVVRMGEADPDAQLARWHHTGGLECHFRWVAEGERVMDYPLADIERITLTLAEVDWDCDCRNIGDRGYCLGDRQLGFLYRSTDADVQLWLDQGHLEDNGGDVLFRGFVGAADTGGWIPGVATGGWMFFDRRCEPTPIDGEAEPGFCGEPPMCRYFSGDGVLEACRWQDIRALPANPALIDPAWGDAHSDAYAEVFGAR